MSPFQVQPFSEGRPAEGIKNLLSWTLSTRSSITEPAVCSPRSFFSKAAWSSAAPGEGFSGLRVMPPLKASAEAGTLPMAR